MGHVEGGHVGRFLVDEFLKEDMANGGMFEVAVGHDAFEVSSMSVDVPGDNCLSVVGQVNCGSMEEGAFDVCLCRFAVDSCVFFCFTHAYG